MREACRLVAQLEKRQRGGSAKASRRGSRFSGTDDAASAPAGPAPAPAAGGGWGLGRLFGKGQGGGEAGVPDVAGMAGQLRDADLTPQELALEWETAQSECAGLAGSAMRLRRREWGPGGGAGH